jgi:hypothetical protein
MLYEIINEFKNTEETKLFWYITIFIVIIAILHFLKISMITTIGIVFGIIIVLNIKSYENKEQEKINEIYKQKKESIRPKPKKIQNYDELTDYLYSVQDLYGYNPPAFEELVDNIDALLEVYEESKLLPELAGNNYSIAETRKHNALNALHSIIHNIPSSHNLIDKFVDSMRVLEILLEKYLNEIYYINEEKIMKEGYNNNTRIINRGPKESNYYDKEIFMYDFY